MMPAVTDVLGWTLRSVPLLALALLAARLCLRGSPGLRHAFLTAGLLGCLALPGADLLGLDGRIPVPEVPSVDLTSLMAWSGVRGEGSATAGRELPAPVRTDAAGPGSPASPPPVDRFLVLLWASGAVILAGRLYRHLLRARAVVAAASPAPRWITSLARSPSGPRGRRTRLYVSPETSTPFATGVLRPVVILPAGATGWSRERLEVVLRHELAHLRRHDTLWIALGLLARALCWWNPLAWLAVKGQKLEAERAADATVLRAGVDPVRYVDEMVALARRALFRGEVPGLAAAGVGSFEQRMRSVLAERGPGSRLGARQLVAVGAGGLALTLGLSALAPGGAPADTARDPWISVSEDGKTLAVAMGATVRFQGTGSLVFRDGRRVVRIPEGARIRVPGLEDPRSESLGRENPRVEIVGPSGILRWVATPTSGLPDEPGTRITDSGSVGQASIDTVNPTVFYLQVVDESSTVFFQPATGP